MQIDKKDFDPEQHDRFRALIVRQPLADLLTVAAYLDEDGKYHAGKSIIIRPRNTQYRGEVLICSAEPAETCGLAELFETKRVEEMTEQEWDEAYFDGERPTKGFSWRFRNPRRVVEMPIAGKCGFYDLAVPKGDITEYPREMALGFDGWKIIQNKIL